MNYMMNTTIVCISSSVAYIFQLCDELDIANYSSLIISYRLHGILIYFFIPRSSIALSFSMKDYLYLSLYIRVVLYSSSNYYYSLLSTALQWYLTLNYSLLSNSWLWITDIHDIILNPSYPYSGYTIKQSSLLTCNRQSTCRCSKFLLVILA